ncbi:MAG TPA: hypothetical protein VMV09_04010, partial [Candidatus Saccharimonadales bacterium]|nr:hypothetical protein [Candidatus Saccharimonadales bacterium]
MSCGTWWWQTARCANRAAFIRFCEYLVAAHPQAPALTVVLDQVIIDSSRAVQAWLLFHPQI